MHNFFLGTIDPFCTIITSCPYLWWQAFYCDFKCGCSEHNTSAFRRLWISYKLVCFEHAPAFMTFILFADVFVVELIKMFPHYIDEKHFWNVFAVASYLYIKLTFGWLILQNLGTVWRWLFPVLLIIFDPVGVHYAGLINGCLSRSQNVPQGIASSSSELPGLRGKGVHKSDSERAQSLLLLETGCKNRWLYCHFTHPDDI